VQLDLLASLADRAFDHEARAALGQVAQRSGPALTAVGAPDLDAGRDLDAGVDPLLFARRHEASLGYHVGSEGVLGPLVARVAPTQLFSQLWIVTSPEAGEILGDLHGA